MVMPRRLNIVIEIEKHKLCSLYWLILRAVFISMVLTLGRRMTHICIGKLIITGSDNGLSPGRRGATIWINARILLIGPLRTHFSEILIEIQAFSMKKIRLKMSSAKCCPFRLGLNVFTRQDIWFLSYMIKDFICPRQLEV